MSRILSTSETATAADGTHPTGMHSCCYHKNAFQWDAYRPLVDRIPACTVAGGVPAWGCTCLGGGCTCLGGGCTCPEGGCICLGAVPARGYLPGGVPAWGVPARGVPVQGGVSARVYLPGGCTCQGGVMYLPGGTCLGGTCPGTPPVDRQTPVKT